MKKNYHKGFTLSEVLITLVVLGVVAALTMPNLVKNTHKAEYIVLLKKRLAEISQAVELAKVTHGSVAMWDWDLDTDEFIEKYITSYVKLTPCADCWKTAKNSEGLFFEQVAHAAAASGGYVCTTDLGTDTRLTNEANATPADEPEVTYTMRDGSQMGFYKDNTNKILFTYIDANGNGSPNKWGSDKFLFTTSSQRTVFFGEGIEKLNATDYGCSTTGNKMYCGALIKQNNWQYPIDYMKAPTTGTTCSWQGGHF